MKKLLLSCVVLIGICSAQAQISINKSDFASVGDTLFYSSDTVNINVNMAASAGSNQVWDFSSVSKNKTAPSWFLDPSGSPVTAPANITHVFIDEDASSTTFMNATDTALYNIRPNPAFTFIGGDPFLGLRSLKFPLNYQDISTDSIKSTSTIAGNNIGIGELADSVRVTISISLKSICDGWGTLKTPKSTYPALRINNTIVSVFKFEGKKSPLPFWFNIPVSALPLPVPAKQTEISYVWLGTNSKYFLAETNMVTDNETERDFFRWQTDRPVNNGLISYRKNNIPVSTYPNPATNEINLEFNLNNSSAMDVVFYDLKGQKIHSLSKSCFSGINTLNINTTNLPAGLYHVIVSGNGKSASVRISITK